jgi:hypothetical protein
MGVRTRGLDIKAGAAKMKADRATRFNDQIEPMTLVAVAFDPWQL